MSENTAATTARGADPKSPAKNRQIMTVWRSFPTATAKLKQAMAKGAMIKGNRRPFSSERGAQKMGPKAKPDEVSSIQNNQQMVKPKTYKLVPNVVTSRLT
jgi:hypothetical protein